MKEYYAHSGESDKGIIPQTYKDHVGNVYQRTQADCSILSDFWRKAVCIAALHHDLGKLDEDSQKILSQPDRVEGVKMLNHVDAGVCWCLREYKKTKDEVFIYAAYLILAHHIGLQDRDDILNVKVGMSLSPEFIIKDAFRDINIKKYVDKTLDGLYKIQSFFFKDEIEDINKMSYGKTNISSLQLRMALSILVSGDHGDTAKFYGAPVFKTLEMQPLERIECLDKHVKNVAKEATLRGISDEVITSRNELFRTCSEVDLEDYRFFLCAAPVGKGKILALMKLALRIAKKENKNRIFFIIPFTNIISQSVKVYRESIVIKGEDPFYVVNEIHSKVEFSGMFMRKYTQEWNAPVNISTSVQFFDSLFSNRPSALKKLKAFANSVLVFDEYHTALPHNLWKVALKTLKEASELFNITVVFGSGSHVMYWEIFGIDLVVKDVVPNHIFDTFKKYESERISYVNLGYMKNEEDFDNRFRKIATNAEGKLKKHTVIVLNTIANAVNLTKHFLNSTDWKIFHLSSHICPTHREEILDKIKKALKDDSEKILVISTSTIECGVDVSFKCAFRERASLMSSIQLGGRVNRNKEESCGSSFVYEFAFDLKWLSSDSNSYSMNPGLIESIKCRRGLTVDPDNCTNAIEEEVDHSKASDLCINEERFMFETMNDAFSVIDTFTRTVIIDPDIVREMKDGKFVEPSKINRNSISVYADYVDVGGKWSHLVKTFLFDEKREIYYWIGEYDPDMFGIHIDRTLG